MQAENLMAVPETADDFGDAVRVLRSLDVSRGVSFNASSLPEDRCARHLIKNLGRRMPEDVVIEEQEPLASVRKGSSSSARGAVTRTPRRNVQ
jgi:hypothetical protein